MYPPRYLKTMNILQISRKKQNYSIHFLQNSTPYPGGIYLFKVPIVNLEQVNDGWVIRNNSQLPPTVSYKINERLSSVKITDDDIFKIIAKLDANKAHGHDNISIRMKKICSTSICKPWKLIFDRCIDNGIYPCE